MVAKFLSGLDTNLRPILDSLLSIDNIPTLSNALSCVLHVTTGRTADSTDTPAMYTCGRGRGFDPAKDA